jgi:hypothetical protein
MSLVGLFIGLIVVALLFANIQALFFYNLVNSKGVRIISWLKSEIIHIIFFSFFGSIIFYLFNGVIFYEFVIRNSRHSTAWYDKGEPNYYLISISVIIIEAVIGFYYNLIINNIIKKGGVSISKARKSLLLISLYILANLAFISVAVSSGF